MKYMSWEEQFNILKEYYLEHNNCKINKKHKLYNWSCRQRMDRKDGILTIEKENLLLSIDFKFNESWDEMFNKFLIYFKKYKTLEISQDNEFYNELNSWIKRQISLIKNNKLPKDKIKKYEDLGILIERKRGLNEIWMDSYTELKQFYLDNNNCNIPNTNEYKSLYRFVQTQRTNYKNNKLSEEKITLLKEIKFVFDLWEDNYNIAKSYYLKYNSLIIDNDNDEFKSLKNWIYNTRQNYKNNKLTNKQIDLLKEIDFPFEVISCDKQWLNYYSKCKKFYESKKDYYNFSNDLYKGLFEWMLEQSRLYIIDELSSYKLNLLNRINFDFNIYKYYGVEKEWLKSYFKLSKLLKYNNSYYIDYMNDKDIKCWIINQCKNKHILDNNKIYLLKEINFNFNLDKKLEIDYKYLENSCDKQWLNYYSKCKKFYESKKDYYNFSNDLYRGLFEWMLEQSRLYIIDELSSYKLNLLNRINFDFNIYKYYGVEKEWLKPYFKLSKLLKYNNSYYIDYRNNEDIKYWIINQCKNKHILDNNKIYLLKEINFNFNLYKKLEIDYEWLENFNLIKNTKELQVSKIIIKNSNSSIKWIYEQYPLYTNELISEYQTKLLKGINFDKFKDMYKYIDIEWITFYKKLYKFYKSNNSYNINPFEHSENLFKWSLEQTELFNNNLLAKQKINLLRAINFDFNTQPLSKSEIKWLEYYNKLKTFRKNYGHFMVDDYGSFKKLHRWVKKQENNHKHGLLKDKYYNLMIKIGFEFNNSWNIMFNRLNIYYNLNNHSLNIPINKYLQYKEIDIWLKRQVKLYQDNKLPSQIIKKYNDIGINLDDIALITPTKSPSAIIEGACNSI